MTCPSCGMENTRNSRVCARCGAKLVWDGPKGARHFRPPRAKGWRKTVYPLHQYLHKRDGAAAEEANGGSLKELLDRVPARTFFICLASVIPGSGLFFTGKGKRGRIIALIWFCCMALALFLSPRFWSAIPLAAGFALHYHAMVEAAQLGDFCLERWQYRFVRAALAVFLLLAYSLAYHLIDFGLIRSILFADYSAYFPG